MAAQVALRRQQAQEEAEARQLGVEILKPGDRAELVMGNDGIIRREKTVSEEAEKEEEEELKRKQEEIEDQGNSEDHNAFYIYINSIYFLTDVKKRKISFDVVSNMLEENSDVANTNSNEFEDNDEEEDTDKEQDKMSSPQPVSQTDDTFHRGLDILQKLFPQKDKVRDTFTGNMILRELY